MNKDLLDILSGNNKETDSGKLVDYLNGNLSPEESHEIEALMADSDFMNDAVEGLENIKDKKNIQAYVEQLNKDLQKQLAKKKQRREKRKLKEDPWTYYTIVIVLLLCMIGYYVIRQYLNRD